MSAWLDASADRSAVGSVVGRPASAPFRSAGRGWVKAMSPDRQFPPLSPPWKASLMSNPQIPQVLQVPPVPKTSRGVGRRRRVTLAAFAVAASTALVVAQAEPADAHVTVSSPDAAPGGFGKLVFRVPSESDTAMTTAVKVTLPAETPFAFVSTKPVPGWTVTTTEAKLAKPIKAEGFTLTKAVSTVTWTAAKGQGLRPGEFDEFEVSVGPFPEQPGTLAMPAVQSYSDGTKVAWDQPTVKGGAEPEHPAPTLELTAAAGAARRRAATPRVHRRRTRLRPRSRRLTPTRRAMIRWLGGSEVSAWSSVPPGSCSRCCSADGVSCERGSDFAGGVLGQHAQAPRWQVLGAGPCCQRSGGSSALRGGCAGLGAREPGQRDPGGRGRGDQCTRAGGARVQREHPHALDHRRHRPQRPSQSRNCARRGQYGQHRCGSAGQARVRGPLRLRLPGHLCRRAPRRRPAGFRLPTTRGHRRPDRQGEAGNPGQPRSFGGLVDRWRRRGRGGGRVVVRRPSGADSTLKDTVVTRQGSLRRWLAATMLLAGLTLVVALVTGGGAPKPSPAGLPDGGPLTGWGLPASRLLADLAGIITLGLLLSAGFLLPSKAARLSPAAGRGAQLAVRTAMVWAAAVVVETALTISDIFGSPADQVLGATMVRSFLTQIPQGRALLAQLILVLVVAGVARSLLTSRGAALGAVLALAALAPPVLTGHSAASGNHELAVASLLVHVLAAAAWTGGLGALAWAGFVATTPEAPTEPGLRHAVPRFSLLAAICCASVAISGVVNAALRLGDLGAWVSTPLRAAGPRQDSRPADPGRVRLVAPATHGRAARGGRHQDSCPVRAGRCCRAGRDGVRPSALAVGLARTPTPVGEAVDTSPATELLGFPLPARTDGGPAGVRTGRRTGSRSPFSSSPHSCTPRACWTLRRRGDALAARPHPGLVRRTGSRRVGHRRRTRPLLPRAVQRAHGRAHAAEHGRADRPGPRRAAHARAARPARAARARRDRACGRC